MNEELVKLVEEKTKLRSKQIEAVLSLLGEGATIPFIARYRKEMTGNLDEEQIRSIVVIYEYEEKLANRKEEVIALIEKKDKLTDEIKEKVLACKTLSEIEDIYLPYKEKKKTRATTAIANGLEPLADLIMECKNRDIEEEAKKYINDKVKTSEEAINGAKDIIAERFSENATFRQGLREDLNKYGLVNTSLKKDAVDEKQVYTLYYNKSEPVKYIVPHRVLAINRGEKEEVLKVKIDFNEEMFIDYVNRKMIRNSVANEAKYIKEAIIDGYTRLLLPSIEREVRNELTEVAHEQAIKVFSLNLEQLLLTPPLKNRIIMGFDPAFRTGCKLAVINLNGDFIYKDVIYPHEKSVGEIVTDERKEASELKLVDIVKKFNVELIAIGNGTASRESEEFVANTIKKYKLNCNYIIVSEAGASVYSASEEARKEFPDLHVEERSAVSIARRVMDPLSELIKIDPKSIGVGQYQHDVNQAKLDETLDFVISKVVNSVGVNVNTASVDLLSYVSGLNRKSAKNIVDYRSEKGLIKDRKEISKIKGIGAKTYEQAIGFLKIYESKNPLDKTFIHPDNYKEVEKLLSDLSYDSSYLGSEEINKALEKINIDELINKYNLGTYTLNDIVEEIKKPLRDIRDNYPTPVLKSDILHIEDLQVGLELEGTVRSIVDFGAFVDIGLKNDGLIHKSRMSTSRISHPLDVVSVGEIVKVYVCDIDLEKKRVGLSLIKNL